MLRDVACECASLCAVVCSVYAMCVVRSLTLVVVAVRCCCCCGLSFVLIVLLVVVVRCFVLFVFVRCCLYA